MSNTAHTNKCDINDVQYLAELPGWLKCKEEFNRTQTKRQMPITKKCWNVFQVAVHNGNIWTENLQRQTCWQIRTPQTVFRSSEPTKVLRVVSLYHHEVREPKPSAPFWNMNTDECRHTLTPRQWQEIGARQAAKRHLSPWDTLVNFCWLCDFRLELFVGGTGERVPWKRRKHFSENLMTASTSSAARHSPHSHSHLGWLTVTQPSWMTYCYQNQTI